jgi:hypothetical protein
MHSPPAPGGENSAFRDIIQDYESRSDNYGAFFHALRQYVTAQQQFSRVKVDNFCVLRPDRREKAVYG